MRRLLSSSESEILVLVHKLTVPGDSNLCEGAGDGETCALVHTELLPETMERVFSASGTGTHSTAQDNPQHEFLLLVANFIHMATSNKDTWSCNNKTCRGIGCADSAFAFPSNDKCADQRQQAISNQDMNKVESEAVKKHP